MTTSKTFTFTDSQVEHLILGLDYDESIDEAHAAKIAAIKPGKPVELTEAEIRTASVIFQDWIYHFEGQIELKATMRQNREQFTFKQYRLACQNGLETLGGVAKPLRTGAVQ